MTDEELAQWLDDEAMRLSQRGWRDSCDSNSCGIASNNAGDAAARLRALSQEVSAKDAENIRLRAALAHSKSPCVYCSLPAEDWAKCQSGFPGCDRADDAMGCPELGASMQIRDGE